MSEVLNIGIIGCGGISATHLRAIASLPDARPVAFCDTVLEKAENRRAEFADADAAVYEDYHDLLANPAVDIVHIATPHYLHAQMVLDALKAGKYVLCEKPMAIHKEDAKAMIEADKDGRLAIVFQNRYNPSTVKAKEIIKNNTLGKLLTIQANVLWKRDAKYYALGEWRGKWATEGGGSLINQAIHTIDLMYYLGGPFAKVKGSITRDVLRDDIEVEDNAHAVFLYQDGMRGLLHTSNNLGVDNPAQVILSFEHGVLTIHGEMLWLEQNHQMTCLVSGEPPKDGTKAEYGSSHKTQIAEFYQSIRDKRRFWIDGKDAYPANWAVFSIYDSSKSDEWVAFDG